MGKKACKKKKTAQRNSDSFPLYGSKYSNSESPQIEYEQANETLSTKHNHQNTEQNTEFCNNNQIQLQLQISYFILYTLL